MSARTLILGLGLASALGLSSCDEDDGPSVDDHFLNYEVPEEPVDRDYLVGAFYTFAPFTPNVTAEPVAGRYAPASAEAYAEHLGDAARAGIDFFVFDVRGGNAPAEFREDSARVAALLAAPGAEGQGFAIAFDFANYNLNNAARRIERPEGLLDQFVGDVRRLGEAFLSRANYAAVGGRKIVYLRGAQNLFADDDAAVYARLRADLAADGHDLYLIGEQPAWTPPGRWDFRFVGNVDAVSHYRYAQIQSGFFSRFQLFETVVDQAWQYHREVFEGQGLAYVPQVSPAFDRRFAAPASNDFVFERDGGEFFSAYANLARRAATGPVVLVDSFNDFKVGNQVEPTESYGDAFLDAVAAEFTPN